MLLAGWGWSHTCRWLQVYCLNFDLRGYLGWIACYFLGQQWGLPEVHPRNTHWVRLRVPSITRMLLSSWVCVLPDFYTSVPASSARGLPAWRKVYGLKIMVRITWGEVNFTFWIRPADTCSKNAILRFHARITDKTTAWLIITQRLHEITEFGHRQFVGGSCCRLCECKQQRQ